MTRALVTGGSKGIGRAICLRLAKDALAKGDKASIVVTATGLQPDLKAVVAELNAMGASAIGVPGDLNDPKVPQELVAKTLDHCGGGLDAIIHNAGGSIPASLRHTKVEDWDAVFAVNCRALFLLGVAAFDALRESRGSLVAIGSGAGIGVQPGLNAYPCAKAAELMLVQQMAFEWGRYGIRVNCVAPGFTMSRSTETALVDPEDKAKMGARIPIGRVGEPEDIAGVVAFVVGPDGAYITGENINVDGGMRHLGANAMMNPPGNWKGQHAVRNMRPSGRSGS